MQFGIKLHRELQKIIFKIKNDSCEAPLTSQLSFFIGYYNQKEKVTKENVLNGFSTPSNFFLSANVIRDTLPSLFILGALITRSDIMITDNKENIKKNISII